MLRALAVERGQSGSGIADAFANLLGQRLLRQRLRGQQLLRVLRGEYVYADDAYSEQGASDQDQDQNQNQDQAGFYFSDSE